jgi:hypothetical protein
MQDERIAKSYRTSTLSNIQIVVDLGSAKTVTTAALLGHNLTAAATVRFSGAGSSYELTTGLETILRFVTPSDESYDIVTEASDQLTTEADDALITGTSPTTIQTCVFEISDAANPDGYIEIGRIWIGDYIDIDPSSLNDFTVAKKRSDVVIFGKDRQKWASEGVGWRKFALQFPPSDEAMIEKISDMYDAVGNYKALIFCNFDTIRDYILVEPCYCSIDGEIQFNHQERMRFGYSLNLEEVK